MGLSFEDFVEAAGARLLRTAVLLCGDVHAGEDLVQEALLRVSQRWDRVGDHPEAYTRRVLATLSIDRWRRTARRPETRLDLSGSEPFSSVAGAPEDRLVILAALHQLPRRQRAVIVLRYYEDLTEAETARVLDISVGSVKQHSRRAVVALRLSLAGSFTAGDVGHSPPTGDHHA